MLLHDTFTLYVLIPRLCFSRNIIFFRRQIHILFIGCLSLLRSLLFIKTIANFYRLIPLFINLQLPIQIVIVVVFDICYYFLDLILISNLLDLYGINLSSYKSNLLPLIQWFLTHYVLQGISICGPSSLLTWACFRLCFDARLLCSTWVSSLCWMDHRKLMLLLDNRIDRLVGEAYVIQAS